MCRLKYYLKYLYRVLLFSSSIFLAGDVFAQLPQNDSCQNAIEIGLGTGGFSIGTFQSDSINIDSATLQVGEYFHSSLVSSGNDKKTIWFKFYIPARRGVNIELKQNANAIATKDVGFTTYLTDQCLPASTAATNAKLTTLNQFGSSFHPCMDPGWYLVQVSSKARAMGKVYLEITTIYPHQYPAVVNAEYDDQDSAYDFGDQIVGKYGSQSAYVDYEMGCYTISDSTEFFKDLGSNYLAYNQSAWFVFKANRDHDNTQLKLSHKSGCSTTDTVAFRLFKGDSRGGGSLQLLDSMYSDWRAANTCYTNCSEIVRDYKCLFDSGETYSVQLLYHKDLIKTMRFRISDQTSQYDSGRYQPNSSYAKDLGIIRGNNSFNTGFSCGSYITQNTCGNANSTSIAIGGYDYNMAQWYEFTLDQQSKLSVQATYGSNGNYKRYQQLAFRLFKDTVTSSCTGIDTNNVLIKATGNGTYTVDCLEPGKYTIQLLGTDTVRDYSNWPCSGSMHLGGDYKFNLNQSRLPVANRFALTNVGEGDSIYSLNDLPKYTTVNGQIDTISCNDAVRPLEICDSAYKKAMYRTFVIGDADNDGLADSGMLYMSSWQTVYRGYPYYDYNAWHRIYKGDALALRSTQSVSGYPDTLTGLTAHSDCFAQSTSAASGCLEPGTYTLVSYFDSIGISRTETPRFQFYSAKRKFNTYSKAQFIDSITSYGTYTGEVDTFNCNVNPDTIDGQYCGKRNAYRVFYLDSTAVTTINVGYYPYHYGGARFSLFSGDIRNGKSGLKLYDDGLDWSCTGYYRTTSDCKPLEAGWYTVVVSNDWDIDYDSANRYQSGNSTGLFQYPHNITITTRASSITPPKFYRPSKAAFIDSLVNGNKSLSYDTNYSAISGMYLNLAKYTFPKEILECDLDTPLNHHPKSTLCDTNTTDIVYYTFTTAKDAYVRIYANKSGGTWDVKLYDFDVRKDSAKLATATPIQDCNYDANYIAFCNLLAGTYSVVYYCKRTAGTRATVQPVLHMDSVADSRFDHASNAYDFGKIPGNSSFYDGKIGDFHPKDTSLPASHDMITCRTGAQRTDPTEVGCYGHVSPYVYSKDTNAGYFLYDSSSYRYSDNTTYYPWGSPVRRNLWYSFVVEGRGNVTVDLKGNTSNLINGLNQSVRFAIYESDEDGSLSLASLKSSGKIDSTKNDGLTYVDRDYTYCYYTSDLSATFAISSCEKVKPRRYYVLVETTNYYNQRQSPNLNHNIWLEIKYDSLYIPDTEFDYYSTANDINGLNDANLLVNGGFDATTGWTSTSGSWTYNRSDVTPVSGGHVWAYYKPYQSKGDTGIIYQDVDVSAYASFIAAGSATSSLSGYIQSKNETNPDEGRIKLQYINSSGGVISQFTSSWVKSIGGWQSVSDSRTIPTGTVKIRVQLEALYKSSNNYNDVYFDDFDLRISTPNKNNPAPLAGQRLYQGDLTYFAGSTLDSTDYNRTYYSNCGNSATAGTVWYKFDVDSTGFLHYNYLYSYLSGTNTLTRTSYDNNRIRVYRSTAVGDSLSGLTRIPPISSSNKYRSLMSNGTAYYICVNPGTYYIQINKCDQHACSDYVIPQLVFDFHTGDFCETAVPLRLDSLGLVKDRLLVDCHTIGTDFGEDGSDMGCLYGPKDYKSSWFVVDYTDTTKVDLEFKLGEYTDATASEIRYRTYYGNCKSLTSGPCNNNALTTFTLDCIRKGTYYVQIVTPDGAKGELEMSAEAKVNTDTTCNPVDIFQPNAAFYYNTGCPENVIEFVNTSSRGDSIRYFWDFGYNGLTDTALNPVVIYPPSSEEKSYTVKLVVEQIEYRSKDSIEIVIDVPFAPNLDILQNDTNLCLGDSVTLTAVLSHGDGVWSTGDSSNSITVNSTGTYFYKMQDKPHLLENASLEKDMASYGWTINSGNWNRTSSYSPRDSSYVGYASHSAAASTGVLEAYQDIDISSDSVEIDSGIAKTSITGFIKGHSSYEDEGQIILQYLDANNNLLAIYQSGLKNYNNDWQYLEHSRTTPKTSRKLRVILQSNKVNTSTTTSYTFFDFLKVKMRSACPYVDSVYVQVNPYPVVSLPSDTTICANDSIAIRPTVTYFSPYLVKDSMNSSITGSVKNNATHSASDGYVQLTSEDIFSGNGQIEWEDSTLSLTDSFTVTFDYFSSGKNYYALWFYLFNTTTPTNEDFSGGGYSFAFDGNNQLQFEWNNARLNTHNTGIDLDNGGWHNVKIYYRNQYVEIYIDGVLYLSYTDGITRTQTGFKFGVGARSYYNNAYRLKNFQLSKNNSELVVITPQSERQYNYTWSDASSDSVKYLSPIQKLVVSVVDGFGCESNTDSIEVTQFPKIDSLFTSDENICSLLDSFTLTKPDTNGYFYGNNAVDSTGLVVVDSASFGSNSVYFSVIDTNGCLALDTGFFIVDSIPTLVFNPVDTLCKNDSSVQLVVNHTDGYYFGGIYVDSSGLFTPSLTNQSVNRVYYKTYSTDCEAIDSIDIVVDTIPSASIIPAGPFCENDTIFQLYPVSATSGLFTQGAYIDSTGKFDPSIALAGSHTVYYTTTNGSGCSNTDSIIVVVDSTPDASIRPAGPFCENSGVQVLQPIGSTSGTFIKTAYLDSLGNFNPSIANTGTHLAQYAITDGNGCSNTDSTYITVDSIPSVSISSNQPYCVNSAKDTLIGLINSGGSFSGGAYIDTAGVFNPFVAQKGSHKVYYTFTDGNGCVAVDSAVIQVDTTTPVTINTTSPYCLNDTVSKLTASPFLGGYFSGGTYIDSAGNFNPSIAGQGSHSINFTQTNGKGCITYASTVIYVDSLPSATLVQPSDLCLNDDSIKITALFSGGRFVATAYNDTSGWFNPAYSGIGSHEVVYERENGSGCIGRDTVFVRVDSLPNAAISASGPYCENDSIQIITGSVNTFGKFVQTSYLDTNGRFNPKIALAGKHKAVYKVTDGNGCSNKDSIVISVDSLPNAAINPAGPFCVNDTVQRINTVSNGGTFTPTTYIDSNGYFNPYSATPGNHKVIYTIQNANGCSASDSLFVTVDTLPDASIQSAGPFCENAGIQTIRPVTNSGGTFGKTAYIDSSGKFDPFIAKAGSHIITYTFTDNNGCTSADTTIVTVDSLPNASVQPAGPFCLNAGVQTILAAVNTGGKFRPLPYIDSAGRFDPMIADVGAHKIYYSYTDGNGCSNADTTIVTVDSLPNASIIDPGSICQNAGVQVIKPELSGGKFITASYLDTAGNFDPQIAGVGSFTIFYEITNTAGCIGLDSISVIVDSIPNATINALKVCENADTIRLTTEVVGGKFIQTAYLDTTGLFNPTIAKNGNHKVFYSYTDGKGCSNIDSNTVIVDTIPDARIAQAGPFCFNSGVKTLAAVVSAGGEFGPLPYIDSAGRFDPMIADVGNHKIYYSYTDGNGCSNTDSSSIRVDSLPNASIKDPGAICQNGGIQLIEPEIVGGKFVATTYIDTAGNFDPQIAGIGSHRIYYEINDGAGCSGLDSLEIRVDSIPNAAINPMKVCENADTMRLIPVVAGGRFVETTYLDSNGLFDPAIAKAGTHWVYYQNEDGNGCLNIDSNTVVVDSIPNAAIKPAGPFCPNAGNQVIQPENLIGGKFIASTVIDTNGVFRPIIAGTGDHKIYYQLTDGNGCWAMDSAIIKVDSFPNAAIIPAGPFCKNDTIQLLESVVAGDGRFSSTSYLDTSGNFNPTVADVGLHKIFYTATDGNGCSNIDSTTIQVDSIPNAQIAPAGPFCENGGIQTISALFNSIGSFRVETYLTSTGTFDPKIAASGQHWVLYSVLDGNGCSNKDSLQITVDTIPDASIVAAGPFCVNDLPQQLVAQTNSGGAFSGNGTSATGLFEPGIATSGNHRIYYSFTDGNTCLSTDSIQVIVNDNPDATITPINPLCLNDNPVQIIPNSMGGLFSGGQYVSSAGLFTPEDAVIGTNKVVYSLTNASNCSASDSIEVEVLSLPTNTILLNPHEGCEPLPVFISTEKVGNEDSVSWYILGQFENDQYNFSKTFDKGLYPIQLRVFGTNGCDITKDTSIDVFPKPTASFNYSPTDIYLSNPLVTFKDLSVLNIVAWDWNFGDFESSTNQNPKHAYTEGGEYPVTLVVENDKGCLDTTQQTLIVNDELLVFIPNAISPNGDGNNDVFKVVGLGYENIIIQIFNRWGERIFESEDFKQWDGTYMGEKVQMGSYVYIMTITDLRGMKHHKKGEISIIR